jgi:hypothetical protein
MNGTRLACGLGASLVLSLVGCQKQRDDLQNAVNAAKAVTEMTSDLKAAGEQAKAAGKLAEAQAKADLAAGKDPAQVKQQVELAKGMAAMQALGGAGGPVVNWRQLGAFLPDSLGELKAAHELDGKTEKMGALQISSAKRQYTSGESQVRVSITDSSGAPMMRAPFALAAMVEEDSSSGYKKGKKIAGYTAIVEWKERAKRSEVTMLLGERFVVNVEVDKAAKPDAAEAIAQSLKLDDLAKLKAEP